MKKYFTLFLIMIALSARSQEYHIVSPTIPSTTGSVSVDGMTKRIQESAVEYAKYAPVPRFAQIDYAFGSTLDEFKKMGGFGIVYIPSLNRDIAEYPIKRVYFKIDGVITELKKIGELKIKNTDPKTVTTFGENRVDYYYLLPYNLTLKKGEILIDWSANRKEFVLAKFPDGNKLDFLNDTDLKSDEKSIDIKTLRAFLIREYNKDIN
jgi:hypothetical protein